MADLIAGKLGTVVVLGSVHTDLIAAADKLPGPGQSVTGTSFATAPGGKAANQACQLARCGADVALIGKVGTDQPGVELRAKLEAAGVCTRFLAVDAEAPTGTSTVLTAAGEYTSIIVPGASARLTTSEVDAAFASIADPVALVLQLELPLDIVTYTAERAAGRGMTVVLNASPVPDDPASIPSELWEATEILVANREEANALLISAMESPDAVVMAQALAGAYGVETVAITLGSGGAAMYSAERFLEQLAYPAQVIDTIGAGDAFLGTLVAGMVVRLPIELALRRAVAAGALAVGGRGALESIPNAAQIEELVQRHSESQGHNNSLGSSQERHR